MWFLAVKFAKGILTISLVISMVEEAPKNIKYGVLFSAMMVGVILKNSFGLLLVHHHGCTC